MTDLTNHYWQLPDGRVWSTARAAFVPADDPALASWLASQVFNDGGFDPSSSFTPSIPLSPKDEAGEHSLEGLRAALEFYHLPKGELETEAERNALRAAQIKARLTELDAASARPLRAIVGNSATDADRDKLAELEREAVNLRAELAELIAA